MGGRVSRTDFDWSYTAEPHASRRKEILAKYPQIKKLMGYDPNFKYQVLLLIVIQFTLTYVLKDFSWPVIFLAAYFIGGVINHALLLAIHEISHNLAFGHARPIHNRIFSLIVNFPIGVPCAIAFKKYHLEHHRYQGDEELDVDLPT
ncbi:putative sphingolipid delta(4)-desaturase/C4-monooxygenase [Stylophora pistillata]|uniref:Putative sphingolipid delta(4)-desaturase/C4-hydroxylase n=1 Tax=Stylophora pistillata TaxID=50429 RepID=A0A2B4SJZ4_STYPI|nr:putative sphingolipid delta(4)-desaturase/C4-monooxygenase [Stylophora pistillata]PFX29419.1 putative sphingolipid delta(4)-desaturase/C4-hydroxylase [Stylophora pistillata]